MRQNCVSSAFCFLMGIVLVATPGAAAQPGAADVKLPVPRTFDLTHVEPAHYAVALGKDPAKIFEFVRDQIGYEVYAGALRGPRGTLLAMAGNSVDRAALLASLLQQSGQKVRFARGKLPKAEAKKLVDSMWAERPRPAPAEGEGEPPPALKAALDTLVAGVTRDYTLIREHLKKANVTPSPASAPRFDSLVEEAQDHYWVQWWKDNAWVDLDPSFTDAALGKTYARADQTFTALPDALFHRVSIRVRLEEYSVLNTGNAEGKPSSREILSYTAKAADLSGLDLVFNHQPENWKGPAANLESALASAIENTGSVKPILVIGEGKWVSGQPFRQKLPTGGGIGGIGDLLGGAGSRKAVPVATAEYIEFDFVAPGGRNETAVREIFDLVGRARRAAGKNLNADEVRKRIGDKIAVDLTEAIYGLFLTTGHIQAAHLSNLVEASPPASGEPPDIRAFLRRINVTFTATSDDLIGRVGQPGRAVVLFYPDSPRVQIVEFTSVGRVPRLSLDLRRDHVRAVAMGPHPEDVFFARVFRGVVDGTLERVLVEFITTGAIDKDGWGSAVSTSLLFEKAQAEGVRTVLQTREKAGLSEGIADDTRARIRDEVGRGYWAVAPERPITLDKETRFAWWRIDPRAGETTAVMDDGLHAAWGYTQQINQAGQTVIKVYYSFGRLLTLTFGAGAGWSMKDLETLLQVFKNEGVRRLFYN